MKTIKNIVQPTFVAIAFVCFALLSKVQAVMPPPDGDYPGGNTAEGDRALFNRTIGTYNTAVGFLSLDNNTTGNFNTAVGAATLLLNNGATENTAIGAGALLKNAPFLLNGGNGNTADGAFALFQNSSGSMNTATGDRALFSNTTGASNTAIGNNALANSATGSGNIGLGDSAGSNVTTASNVICIGSPGLNGTNNGCFIGNIFGATASNGAAVFINSNGELGTSNSSRRFKDDIKPMDTASETLFELKPVSFRYKKEIDPTGISQLGLVAEDVEKVNPDLVVRDKEGKPLTVRYEQINAMLLNEFLKEHRKVQELEANTARQQKQIEVLTAGLQKVSAQLEVSKSAPQTALNNQ